MNCCRCAVDYAADGWRFAVVTCYDTGFSRSGFRTERAARHAMIDLLYTAFTAHDGECSFSWKQRASPPAQ